MIKPTAYQLAKIFRQIDLVIPALERIFAKKDDCDVLAFDALERRAPRKDQ